jgi:hypothetical protein
MKRILKFSSFLNESSYNLGSNVNLPDGLLKFLDLSDQRIISQISSSPNFEKIYMEDVDNDGYKELVLIFKGEKIVFPVLKYYFLNDTIILNDKELDETILRDFIRKLENKNLIPKKWNHMDRIDYFLRDFKNIPIYKKYGYYIDIFIIYIIEQIKELDFKSNKTFNPFTDTNIDQNENIKALKKLGCTIDSSPIRTKKGTIVFSNPVYGGDIAITPTGYIRWSDRSGILTRNPELIKPIYSESDLDVKLVYLRIYTIKKKLKSIGLSAKEIKNVLDLIDKNPADYSQNIKKVIEKYPQIVLILPPPEEGFDPSLVKGVSTLKNFGIFD